MGIHGIDLFLFEIRVCGQFILVSHVLIRSRISLELMNVNSKPAEERVIPVKRLFARFVRRLKRGTIQRTGALSVVVPLATSRPKAAAQEVNSRRFAVDAIISVQGQSFERTSLAGRWRRDCGLCAIRNVTGNKSLSLVGLLEMVRPMQLQITPADSTGGSNYLTEGHGDFNGIGLMKYLEVNG